MLGRVRQTWQVVTAWGRAVDDSPAQDILSPAAFALYQQMPRADRKHHLRVLQTLLAGGHTHPALLRAALLHDVGKTRFRFALPQKVLVVLVKAFLPNKFRQWSQAAPKGWRIPFVISGQHPSWSAEMGAAAGLDALTLELIQRHQTKLPSAPQTEADRLLLLLQDADDRS